MNAETSEGEHLYDHSRMFVAELREEMEYVSLADAVANRERAKIEFFGARSNALLDVADRWPLIDRHSTAVIRSTLPEAERRQDEPAVSDAAQPKGSRDGATSHRADDSERSARRSNQWRSRRTNESFKGRLSDELLNETLFSPDGSGKGRTGEMEGRLQQQSSLIPARLAHFFRSCGDLLTRRALALHQIRGSASTPDTTVCKEKPTPETNSELDKSWGNVGAGGLNQEANVPRRSRRGKISGHEDRMS